MIHSGPVTYGAIHFSDRFPVVRTACGHRGPSAGLWRYVTCLACLAAAPSDPRIVERRRMIVQEAERTIEGHTSE